MENSYDAPMLAAAQAVASTDGATMKVFDANNNPQTQFSQLQDVINSGQYNGIIVQPIFGTGLTGLVAQAIAKGIKVVNMDQILGPDLSTDQPQVKGLSANVTFVPTEIGTRLGDLVVQACKAKNLNPCKVGYLFDIKASALDVAINGAFGKAIAGEPVRFRSPRDAISRGVILIAQELATVPSLTVAENVFLGVEPRHAGFQNRRELRRRYTELAASVGFELDGDANVGRLRTADQQKVEILRALCRNAQLIVMDEPTAALSRPDAEALHLVVRQLARSGTTVVLVSHFLNEVLELADEVTILRDGRLVQTVPAAGQTEDSLLSAMLGRPLDAAFPPRRLVPADAPVLLSVRGLTAPGVNDVSFDLRAGEILGLAGLVGAGRTELARAVYRANRVRAGTVSVMGPAGPADAAGPAEAAGAAGPAGAVAMVSVTGTPRTAMRAGLAMIPESRKEQGLLPGRSVVENVTLSSLAQISRAGMVRPRPERRAVRDMLAKVDVRGGSQAAAASALSGGNQQKLLFARSLLRDPLVLIADEPTRGVDVGAKRAIYKLLASLTGRGLGVLLISSDVEEILGLAHRVLVMRAGQIAAEFSGDAATEAAILGAAFGATERGA